MSVLSKFSNNHRHVYHCRYKPSDGVGEIEHCNIVGVEGIENGVDPNNAQSTRTNERNNSGSQRFTKAAHCVAANVQKSAKEVRQTDQAQANHANVNCSLIPGGVNAKQSAAAQLSGKPCRCTDQEDDEVMPQNNGFESFEFFCTYVLTGKVH